MPEWMQILLSGLTVLGSISGSVVLVSFRWGARLSQIDARQEANAKAIADLVTAIGERATAETARGLQAQITRQEGALATHIAEIGSRIERHGSRVDKVEEAHAARESATAAILGELKAGFASLKESVERLITADTARNLRPQEPPNAIEQLRQFVELQSMMKKLA